MSDYKKRAKSGWSAGKKYKSQSNKAERQYEKDEIRQIAKETVQGEDYREKLGKRTRNKEEQAENRVSKYENWKQAAEIRNVGRTYDGIGCISWYNSIVEKAKKQLRKIVIKKKFKGVTLKELREDVEISMASKCYYDEIKSDKSREKWGLPSNYICTCESPWKWNRKKCMEYLAEKECNKDEKLPNKNTD